MFTGESPKNSNPTTSSPAQLRARVSRSRVNKDATIQGRVSVEKPQTG